VNQAAAIFARKGRAAEVTDKAADKWRVTPARATEAEIGRHKGVAGNALRRVNHVQGGLQSLHPSLIFRAMQTPPILTDRPALLRNRNRATEFFLHEEVIAEVKERLTEVNRTFTAPRIVTPFADLWSWIGPTVPDDDLLALDAGQHDLLIHALCLHWANDPVGQLVQCRHALQPDGLFLGFLFGGQTLNELRACLAEAEAEVTGGLSPRILPMGEIRDLGALLQRAGFALPVADSFTKTVFYRDALHLMRDLRQMGEGNALAERLRRPASRSVFSRAAQIYQEQFAEPNGDIRATFEIICLTGWCPHESQQKPLRPGSAAKRLAEALKAAEMPLRYTDGDG
jgi:SAM-dependent methyltransferase